MTMTSTVAGPAQRRSAVSTAGRGQTFWPAPQHPAPEQRTRARRSPRSPPSPAPTTRTDATVSGPMPSLRGLGVDPRSLAAPRPKVRTTVLRCSAPVLRAAQHLLGQATPDATTLAGVVESDPVLVLRVLHLANQHTQGGYAADTVPQAIRVLSPEALAALVAELLAAAGPGSANGLGQILSRGLACEALSGDRIGFTAGVLTALADRLGVPAEIVLQVAGVSREVVTAVRTGTGPWGPALRAVIAYERHDAAGLGRTGSPLSTSTTPACAAPRRRCAPSRPSPRTERTTVLHDHLTTAPAPAKAEARNASLNRAP